MCADLEKLKISKDILTSSEPLKPILDRDLRVFKPSPHAARFQLPDDFYNLTPDEIKREQQHRYGAIPYDTSLPLKPILDRDVRVFKPSPHAARFQLPDDFYNLTPEEIKREQQHRYWAIPLKSSPHPNPS